MEEIKGLNIIVNAKEQRILLIDKDFQPTMHYEIKYDEFEAMMFLSENGGLVATQFLYLNPLLENAFYLKPFFLSQKIASMPFLRDAADGLSADGNEPAVMNKIEEIGKRIKDLNIEIKNEELKKDEKSLLTSIFRFFLSRGDIPKPTLMKGSTLGYTIPIYDFYLEHNRISFKSIISIYKEYIGSKYIEYVDTVDVVQYCKYCNHTHIIYTETCPKCGSCKIKLQNMLHHFVCANISVEASYMVKDHLICPKCQKELHHIGVDYDRPTSVYKCDDCNASFTQANIRGTCVTCKKVSTLNELRRVTIPSLKFSQLGIQKITQWGIYSAEHNGSVCEGFLSYRTFVEYVTNETRKHNISPENNKLTTIRIKGIPLSKVEELSLFIFGNIRHSQCTFKDEYVYVGIVYFDENYIDDSAKLLEKRVKEMDIESYNGVDYVNYSAEISPEDYLRKLF